VKVKLVTIPTKTLPGDGTPNAFLTFLSAVLQQTKQKSNTETYIAHGLAEKIEELQGRSKMPATMTLSREEHAFIMEGLGELRKDGRVTGAGWFYLVDPMTGAEDVDEKPEGRLTKLKS
jgi:hypothetical protein